MSTILAAWPGPNRPCASNSATLFLVDTIPGLGRTTAELLLAEVGPDLSRFPDADHTSLLT